MGRKLRRMPANWTATAKHERYIIAAHEGRVGLYKDDGLSIITIHPAIEEEYAERVGFDIESQEVQQVFAVAE